MTGTAFLLLTRQVYCSKLVTRFIAIDQNRRNHDKKQIGDNGIPFSVTDMG